MSTRVRATDLDNDWLLGKGQNDYKRANDSIAQSIGTRLGSFLGDCFFDLGSGLDWFHLLGAKDRVSLNLTISAIILNTSHVTGILQLTTVLDARRNLTISYQVQTVYSVLTGTFQLDTNAIG